MFVNDQGVARVAQSRPFDSAAFCREWLRERVPPFECRHASFNFIPGREKPQKQNPVCATAAIYLRSVASSITKT
jgi:hypothetical protein